MTRQVAKDDTFLKTLEASVADILADAKTKNSDRLKAIECGARLLMIRHRISGAGEGEDGQFFSKGS